MRGKKALLVSSGLRDRRTVVCLLELLVQVPDPPSAVERGAAALARAFSGTMITDADACSDQAEANSSAGDPSGGSTTGQRRNR